MPYRVLVSANCSPGRESYVVTGQERHLSRGPPGNVNETVPIGLYIKDSQSYTLNAMNVRERGSSHFRAI